MTKSLYFRFLIVFAALVAAAAPLGASAQHEDAPVVVEGAETPPQNLLDHVDPTEQADESGSVVNKAGDEDAAHPEADYASHGASSDHGSGHGSGHGALPAQHWHFSGMFGTFDRAAMQRGLKVYREVCAACHSLKRVYFRNLEALGYNENQIKNIAAEYTVIDGPDDEGEMFERPALPSDHFPGPYANENAAKASNNGAYPPDLSLITKARHSGPDYVYGILTGYTDPPAEVDLLDGQYWNEHMYGNIIAMAPPLSDGQVAYEDGTPQTVEQYSHDVVNFLAWAAEPEMEERKRTGIKVLLFLLVFAGVMYAYKRKIWSDVH